MLRSRLAFTSLTRLKFILLVRKGHSPYLFLSKDTAVEDLGELSPMGFCAPHLLVWAQLTLVSWMPFALQRDAAAFMLCLHSLSRRKGLVRALFLDSVRCSEVVLGYYA